MCTTWSGLPRIWIVWSCDLGRADRLPRQKNPRRSRLRVNRAVLQIRETIFRVDAALSNCPSIRQIYRGRPAFPGGDSGQTTFPSQTGQSHRNPVNATCFRQRMNCTTVRAFTFSGTIPICATGPSASPEHPFSNNSAAWRSASNTPKWTRRNPHPKAMWFASNANREAIHLVGFAR
jgi:hypothetical protein